MAHVLIVEDDKKLARVLSLHLEEEGNEVLVAHTAGEARELLQSEAPEIAILDLMLGADSGLDLIPFARQQPQAPEVILVTAHATSETAARAMQDGAYEYLRKPYALNEVSAES